MHQDLLRYTRYMHYTSRDLHLVQLRCNVLDRVFEARDHNVLERVDTPATFGVQPRQVRESDIGLRVEG